jgi:hypothetical protein
MHYSVVVRLDIEKSSEMRKRRAHKDRRRENGALILALMRPDQ